MKELSLNILDIAQNSIRAGARHVEIALTDGGGWRTLTVTDDGSGMDEALLRRVTDPFATTRTTRPVGLGLPLLKLAGRADGRRAFHRLAHGAGRGRGGGVCGGQRARHARDGHV